MSRCGLLSPRALAHGISLFPETIRRGGQSVEQAVMVVEVLRMPLNAQEEGFRGIFHGFHHPIFGTSCDEQAGGHVVDALVMHGVHLEIPRRAHHLF